MLKFNLTWNARTFFYFYYSPNHHEAPRVTISSSMSSLLSPKVYTTSISLLTYSPSTSDRSKVLAHLFPQPLLFRSISRNFHDSKKLIILLSRKHIQPPFHFWHIPLQLLLDQKVLAHLFPQPLPFRSISRNFPWQQKKLILYHQNLLPWWLKKVHRGQSYHHCGESHCSKIDIAISMFCIFTSIFCLQLLLDQQYLRIYFPSPYLVEASLGIFHDSKKLINIYTFRCCNRKYQSW